MGQYWASTVLEQARYPRLAGELEVDVAVIGAGIVGLTTALLLTQAGKSVAILEARRIGQGATAKSTAKVTSQHGLVYRKLIGDFGADGAMAYATANEAAIRRIEALVRDGAIDCSFETRPAYVYSCSPDEIADLRAEVEAAVGLGLPASFVTEAPLPFPIAGAMRFDRQAQFNPARYLQGLAAALGPTSRIFEDTRVVDIENGDVCTAHTDGGAAVTARAVIVATHMPTVMQSLLFAKAFPLSHPMAAARIDPSRAPSGMFISTGRPSHSFRVDSSGGASVLVAAGGAYTPGETEDEREAARDLDRFLAVNFGVEQVEHRWTNEDFMSIDGMPFVGRVGAGHLYGATGFSAWGITNGTVAGMLLSDLVLGLSNPWAELFDPRRVKAAAGGPAFVKETLKVVGHFVGDRLLKRRPHAIDLAPGEAAIVELEGKQLAVYRQENGTLQAVSAICTHLGCVVGWNATDRSWDCPCHGSRFAIDGTVISGPATAPLDRLTLDEPAGGA